MTRAASAPRPAPAPGAPPRVRATRAALAAFVPTLAAFALALAAQPGCSHPTATAAPRSSARAPDGPRAPSRAPTPASITREEPGGDAPDPAVAALERLLGEPWGARSDKRNTVGVALPDHALWKRVRFRLVPSYVGFRYGNAHHALAAFVVRDPPKGEAVTSDSCLHDFEVWGRDLLRMVGGQATDPTIARSRWKDSFITVRTREGSAPWLFETKRYAGAYGAYVLEGQRCGIVAYAFSMARDPELARRVRDRFSREAFEQLDVRAPLVPPAP